MTMTPKDIVLLISGATGLTPATIGEMPVSTIGLILADIRRPQMRKWTRGELAAIVRENDGDTAIEVLKYLDERGPRCVAWTDEAVPPGGIGCECTDPPSDCPEHGIRRVVQPVEKPATARLDPDGTATGKTILTAPIVGRTTQHAGPASAHVDLETGVRTELREEGED